MKISILVPVYNAERYIGRCACSLLEQTYKDLEFIFVNDCTTDKSIDILKHILKDYPERHSQTKIISHDKNRGVAAARNTLLDNATGDYVLWVDADDFIEKNAAEVLAAKADVTDADIICFGTAWYTKAKGARMMPKNRRSTSIDFIQDVLNGKTASVLWGKLMKLDLFRKHDLKFIEGLNMGEDMMVLVEAAYYSKSIVNVESVLYYQEVGNYDSLSRSYSPKNVDVTLKILDTIELFFAGKIDVSDGLTQRKLELYIRKLYLVCIDGNKSQFNVFRNKMMSLTNEGISPDKKTPYDFYMFCGNYTLCRIYSYLIKWGKSLYRIKRKIIFK